MKVFVAMPLAAKEPPSLRVTVRQAVARAGFSCTFPDEIPGHGRIITDVMDEIATSSAVIAEISDSNPNVIWEHGWASAIGKPVFPITSRREAIFFDTGDHRAIVYDPSNMEATLGQQITIWCERLRASGAQFPPIQLSRSKAYAGLSSELLGINRPAETEFTFFDLLARTETRFFAAAQNHNFLVNEPERLREAIEAFFKKPGKDKRFDLMMCDPAHTAGIEAWVSLSVPEYRNHLRQSAKFFDQLAEWAASHSSIGSRFRLRKVPLVPLSMNFVDPESKHGFVVVTPSFLKSENSGRHCTVVSKLNNAHIFSQYWSWATATFTLHDGA